MKVYEAVFRDDGTHGQYALSLVENPAMQDEWILLSEHPKEIQFTAVDEEKRLLLGATLIPNKRILRNINGNEFEIFFTVETIEKIGHDFIKKGMQNNSSLEHKEKLDGVSVVESWTVQDSQKDKSSIYGKNYDIGTLVQMTKVDNDEIWKKAKDGKIKGFSIDALLGLQEIKLNKIDMSTETSKSVIDAITEKFDAIMVKLNGHKNPEGKLPEAIIELKAEFETKSTELKEEFENKVTEKDEELNKIKIELSEKVKEIEKIGDLSKEIEDLKAELAKEPEVPPIVAKPEVKDTPVHKFASNGVETIEDRVFKQLFPN